MQFTKQEAQKIMQTWAQSENTLRLVLDKLLVEYSEQLVRQPTEWETLRQSIEFTAKKQTLIDLKNYLSKIYGDTANG